MTPERWQQIERLYHAALELDPVARIAFVSQACAGDEELRHEVESLLTSHDQAASFIESSPGDVVAGMMAEEQSRSIIGRTLGHYELRAKIGAGGMGEVYRARDLRLDRDVAVKILPEHLAADAEALRRFEREAKAVAALSHPNILSIFDFGTEAGISYAVMELLEGETLRARLQRGAIGWREAVEIGSAIAEGLSAAHAKNIIHRDLKPENMFLTTGGQVKILDFGIARVKRTISPDAETLTTSIETTQQGVVMGTIGYMSPEQVKGETAEAPSDIFSLGCVLYEMVSGQRPFARRTTAEMIAAILDAEPAPLTGTGKNLPAEIRRVISHCLQKKPDERYQSARDAAFDLKAMLTGKTISAPLPKSLNRRNRLAIRFGAVALAVLIATTAWLFWGNKPVGAIDSLAILPMVNASGDANLDYLSDGITDSLINNLSKLPQSQLRVMARGTVIGYKSKEVDPRKVGEDLKVRAVVTGRLTLRGDNLLINVELANASDGTRLWGEHYDLSLSGILPLQTELAQRISEKLRLKLTGEEQKRVSKQYTDNAAAYQLYLKGRYQSNKLTVEGLRLGIEYMNQAIALDPGYALAYAGLSHAYGDASSVILPADVAVPKSRAAAEQALKLDDTLTEAHTMLAFIKSSYDRNWAEGEKEFLRAIELNPNDATAHQYYGVFLMIQGRTEEGIHEIMRAQTLEPLTKLISAQVGWFHYLARRYDQAISFSQELIKLDSSYSVAHYNLGMVYEQLGNYNEALSAYEQAKQIDSANPYLTSLICRVYALTGRRELVQRLLPDMIEQTKLGNLDPEKVGLVYAALGDKDQAFEWLEKANQGRSDNLLLLKVDPKYDSLRPDPLFKDLLRRLRLSE